MEVELRTVIAIDISLKRAGLNVTLFTRYLELLVVQLLSFYHSQAKHSRWGVVFFDSEVENATVLPTRRASDFTTNSINELRALIKKNLECKPGEFIPRKGNRSKGTSTALRNLLGDFDWEQLAASPERARVGGSSLASIKAEKPKGKENKDPRERAKTHHAVLLFSTCPRTRMEMEAFLGSSSSSTQTQAMEALAAVSDREAALRNAFSDKRILVHWMDTAGLFRREMSSTDTISINSTVDENPCTAAEEECMADTAKQVAGVYGASLIPAEVLLAGHHVTPFSVLFASLLSADRPQLPRPKPSNLNTPLALDAFEPERSPQFTLKRVNGGPSPLTQPSPFKQRNSTRKPSNVHATCRWCGVENPGGGCNVSRAKDEDWPEEIAKQPASATWCGSCEQRFGARSDAVLRVRLSPMDPGSSAAPRVREQDGAPDRVLRSAEIGREAADGGSQEAALPGAKLGSEPACVLVRGVLHAAVPPSELRCDGAFWCQDEEGHGRLEQVLRGLLLGGQVLLVSAPDATGSLAPAVLYPITRKLGGIQLLAQEAAEKKAGPCEPAGEPRRAKGKGAGAGAQTFAWLAQHTFGMRNLDGDGVGRGLATASRMYAATRELVGDGGAAASQQPGSESAGARRRRLAALYGREGGGQEPAAARTPSKPQLARELKQSPTSVFRATAAKLEEAKRDDGDSEMKDSSTVQADAVLKSLKAGYDKIAKSAEGDDVEALHTDIEAAITALQAGGGEEEDAERRVGELLAQHLIVKPKELAAKYKKGGEGGRERATHERNENKLQVYLRMELALLRGRRLERLGAARVAESADAEGTRPIDPLSALQVKNVKLFLTKVFLLDTVIEKSDLTTPGGASDRRAKFLKQVLCRAYAGELPVTIRALSADFGLESDTDTPEASADAAADGGGGGGAKRKREEEEEEKEKEKEKEGAKKGRRMEEEHGGGGGRGGGGDGEGGGGVRKKEEIAPHPAAHRSQNSTPRTTEGGGGGAGGAGGAGVISPATHRIPTPAGGGPGMIRGVTPVLGSRTSTPGDGQAGKARLNGTSNPTLNREISQAARIGALSLKQKTVPKEDKRARRKLAQAQTEPSAAGARVSRTLSSRADTNASRPPRSSSPSAPALLAAQDRKSLQAAQPSACPSGSSILAGSGLHPGQVPPAPPHAGLGTTQPAPGETTPPFSPANLPQLDSNPASTPARCRKARVLVPETPVPSTRKPAVREGPPQVPTSQFEANLKAVAAEAQGRAPREMPVMNLFDAVPGPTEEGGEEPAQGEQQGGGGGGAEQEGAEALEGVWGKGRVTPKRYGAAAKRKAGSSGAEPDAGPGKAAKRKRGVRTASLQSPVAVAALDSESNIADVDAVTPRTTRRRSQARTAGNSEDTGIDKDADARMSKRARVRVM